VEGIISSNTTDPSDSSAFRMFMKNGISQESNEESLPTGTTKIIGLLSDIPKDPI
jgi:hypothetical protein